MGEPENNMSLFCIRRGLVAVAVIDVVKVRIQGFPKERRSFLKMDLWMRGKVKYVKISTLNILAAYHRASFM